MIEKRGEEFVLLDSAGKRVLGRHPTRAKALAQEIAINMAKARRAGHRIPRRRRK